MTNKKIEIGACYRDPDDGEIVRALEAGPAFAAVSASVLVRGSGCAARSGHEVFRILEGWERVADPTPAIVEPAPASTPSEDDRVWVGQRRIDSGPSALVYEVTEIDTDEERARIRFADGGGGWFPLVSIYANPIVPPAAEEDRKPRGIKPPMALIPWEVVPDLWRPEVLDLAFGDGEPSPEGPESFAARVIRILLETEGDDLMYEIARVMGHGAEKYGIGNWQTAAWDDRARLEYESAMLRHLYADAIGEPTDPDSGLPHKAHAAASAMILEWRDRRAARAASED
jgi:hypothetical protein